MGNRRQGAGGHQGPADAARESSRPACREEELSRGFAGSRFAGSRPPFLLEVIVQSVADAEQAEAGGADRLEVVREIERDGLTPPLDLVRSIIAVSSLPLRVMVRESDGFGIARPSELIALQRAFADLADLGVHGAVVGFAHDGVLDLDLIASVLSVAPGLPVTLHRAFDSVNDPETAIDAALAFPQIDRILTSGGSGDWRTRCERLTAWSRRAGPRITILPGGGVDEQGLAVLSGCDRITEAHIGKAAREPQVSTGPVSAARVRHLKSLIKPRN